MKEREADYWREMELAVPTRDVIAAEQNADIKFMAFVLDSILTLPADKIFPQCDAEQSMLELRLKVPESGLLFNAYSVVSFHVKGVGDLYTSEKNIAVAKLLNHQVNHEIRSGRASQAVFRGRLDILNFILGDTAFVGLQLGYVELPRESGLVYLFDRKAPW